MWPLNRKGGCDIEIDPYHPRFVAKNKKYVLGVYISVENVGSVYLLHALYCLVITGLGIVFAVQTLVIRKVFE